MQLRLKLLLAGSTCCSGLLITGDELLVMLPAQIVPVAGAAGPPCAVLSAQAAALSAAAPCRALLWLSFSRQLLQSVTQEGGGERTRQFTHSL